MLDLLDRVLESVVLILYSDDLPRPPVVIVGRYRQLRPRLYEVGPSPLAGRNFTCRQIPRGAVIEKVPPAPAKQFGPRIHRD